MFQDLWNVNCIAFKLCLWKHILLDFCGSVLPIASGLSRSSMSMAQHAISNNSYLPSEILYFQSCFWHSLLSFSHNICFQKAAQQVLEKLFLMLDKVPRSMWNSPFHAIRRAGGTHLEVLRPWKGKIEGLLENPDSRESCQYLIDLLEGRR